MRASLKINRLFLLLILLTGSHARAAGLPSFEAVRAQYHSSYATLLDRNGETLQTLQLDPKSQRLPWVTLQELSPAMQSALLVSEDRRFYQHEGVDWRAIAGAAWENLLHNTHRGASTLTMQLAGLLDPTLTRYAGGRTYIQKWQQIRAAHQLEQHWSKAQILEAYLNLVDFRSNLYGINAAASALFNKTPAAINPAEASILAALLRGPNAKPAVVAERACGVAVLLHTPRSTCNDITALSLHQLPPHPKVQFVTAVAPQAAQQLLHAPGQRIVSSLDMQLQNLTLASLQKSTATASAAVVLDNNTGEILAYANVGTAINNVIAGHPDSTLLQPFIYELAIEQRLLTAASLLDNAPLPIADTAVYPDYMTINPIHAWVSVRTALHAGLDAPALRALALLSTSDYSGRLQLLGLHPANQSNTLLAIANAYQALADNGLYRPASFHVAGLNKPQQIMPIRAAAIVSNILTAQNLAIPKDAVDTTDYFALGSNAHYAVGYNVNYTVALWMDKSNPADTSDAWKRIYSGIESLHPVSQSPKLPDNLIIQAINFIPPIESPRLELFLPGTEQTVFSPPSTGDAALLSQPDVSQISLNYQVQ
jgi:penicillin-binding protein 1C